MLLTTFRNHETSHIQYVCTVYIAHIQCTKISLCYTFDMPLHPSFFYIIVTIRIDTSIRIQRRSILVFVYIIKSNHFFFCQLSSTFHIRIVYIINEMTSTLNTISLFPVLDYALIDQKIKNKDFEDFFEMKLLLSVVCIIIFTAIQTIFF